MELLECFRLLEKYGISVAEYYVFEEEIKEIGYPVCLKISHPKILHKTEKGAVILDIKSKEELEEKIKELKEKFPDGKIIVQKMVSGIPLILGAKRDPVFDYFILIGFGGVYVELIRDFVIIIPPFEKEDFIKMIKNLKLSDIFFGYRGRKINLDIVYETAKKLAKIMENEKINEIEINPFFVTDKGGWAVDCRII